MSLVIKSAMMRRGEVVATAKVENEIGLTLHDQQSKHEDETAQSIKLKRT